MIRVFICGAQSTGKTTLFDSLLSEPENDLHGEAEIARKIIKDLGWKREDYEPTKNPNNFYDFQLKIMKRQSQIDKENNDLNRSYVSDCGIDSLIYCKMYLEGRFEELLGTEEAKECLKRHKASNTLIVVLDPHRECMSDDGMRLNPTRMDKLKEFGDLMKGFLKDQDISFEAISELDLKERVKKLKSLIESKKKSNRVYCNEI